MVIDQKFAVKMRKGVMKQLEKSGLVETITENLQELDQRITDDTDHIKIVTIRNRKSIYMPIKVGKIEGYECLGRYNP